MAYLLMTLTATLLMGLHHSAGSPTEVHQFFPIPDTEEVPPATGELDDLASFLTELLIEDPWEYVGDPLVYVGGEVEEEDPESEVEEGTVSMPVKRSRYYRRYPWKRQNGRYNSDPDGYICNPSKDDVFQLLVALHEAKNGKDRTVHFCNRRRPARAIFTNIRFLGRRK
uniref:Uncharacterized protein n=1 Tax=Graphocephala atropunctata TaxID=36148 RepID=A0A1B6LH95_9HEMI